MEFKYYFLIQDILGVVVALFSLRALYFFVMCMVKRGFAWRYVYAITSYALLLFAGVTLLTQPFGSMPWAVFAASLGLFWYMHRRDRVNAKTAV